IAAAVGSSEAMREVLAGAYVATSEEQLKRLLGVMAEPEPSSGASPEPLVSRLAAQTDADWSVYVGPVRDDHAAGRCVDLVVRQPGGHVETRLVSWRGAGELGRFNLSTQVLDILRRHLAAAKQ
ncbi:MAG: hypothetical protein U1E05_14935, partial [Patescibacteria group bacterium]|nr:hypothetical protein [Patescibacteria group bacterium]